MGLPASRRLASQSASSRITLDALSGTFAMNAGNVRRAVEVADEVLSQPDAPEMAVAWAGSAAALSSARMGRFDEVERLVDRALGSEYPGLLRFTVGLAEITACDQIHLAESVRPEQAPRHASSRRSSGRSS